MKNKLIASSVAGLALVGGTMAFALGTGGAASAATTAQNAVTQTTGGHGPLATLRAHRRELRKEAGQTVADKLGISTDELKQDLKNGQSINEIAAARNVDPATVSDALVAKADARIDQAVANGKIDQAKADTAKTKVPGIVAKVMDHHFGAHASASTGN